MEHETIIAELLKHCAYTREKIAAALLRGLRKNPPHLPGSEKDSECKTDITLADLPLVDRLVCTVDRDASVLPWEEQPSTVNPAHRTVWIVMSVFGSAGNGGLQQLFEGRWPSGFRYTEIADVCREIGLPHVAELFELLVDLFPAEILYDLKGRQKWLWGRTPGSENIPDLVDAMNSSVLDCTREVEVAVINFAMKHLDSYPQTKALLQHL